MTTDILDSGLSLDSLAPNFLLQDVSSGNYYSYTDLCSSTATVVMFICNHCPYVIHINQEIVKLAKEYKDRGVSFIAISSNDIQQVEDDAPDKMKIVAKVLKFSFPYLYDKRQDVALAFGAVCTPEFYVFDHKHILKYHGRFDDSKPNNNIPVTGKDIRRALDLIINRRVIDFETDHSIGCSIKWLKS